MAQKLEQLLRQIADDDRLTLDAASLASVEKRVMEVVRRDAAQQVPVLPWNRRVVEITRAFVPVVPFEAFGRAMVFAGISVLTLVGGGAISAQAYADALPGNRMYDVRLLVERAQVSLAPSVASRVRLLTDIADRRADDVARLAEANADAAVVAIAASAFSDTAAQLTATIDAAPAADAVELAKVVDRRSAGQQATLRRAGRAAAEGAKSSIAKAVRQSERLTIRALAVLVDQHLDGNTQAPRSVVLVNIEDHIASTEAQVQTASQDTTTSRGVRTERAKVAIEEAKQLVKEDRFQAALVKIEEAAELVKEDEVPAADAVVPTDTKPADETAPVTPPTDDRTSTDEADPAPVVELPKDAPAPETVPVEPTPTPVEPAPSTP
jgi:hypothetical protein